MTMLNELKSGDIARIICFENTYNFKKKFYSKEIFDGGIIRISQDVCP